jgi:hypothetical protein
MGRRCASITFAGAACIWSALPVTAHAMYMSESNGIATLQGPITDEDAAKFKEFLAQPRAVPLRVINLSSSGGRVDAGISIARQVRQAKLATVVDAASATCDSACTYIFVAGIRRHYLNSDYVSEGLSGGRGGLGFHPAHRKGASARDVATAGELGSSRARQHYADMGTPRAAELMDKAAFNTLYRIGGQTALALKIATSLSPP